MFYLSQMLGKAVRDAGGTDIGTISDVAIATGEIFPRVTALAFLGPDKTPFMLSWRKYVAGFDGEAATLNVPAKDIRFSYLQPDEVLLHRDLLNKQIVDTQGMKVVRVNDLKLSESRNQLRLLGAEVGTRGILRGISPSVERAVAAITRLAGRELPENLIAWNYMDLLDRDLSHVQLSVTHKRLHELHPADVADILEKLSPTQRAKVFEHLENTQAAEAISELEDEFQADVIDDLGSQRAANLLGIMDPDDAADIIGDLPYEKAEMLLRLMGVKEAGAVRSLLGYKEKTAGGIMTSEVTTVTEEMTVQQVIEFLRGEAAEHESIYYIYVVEDDRHLTGVISLRDLIVSSPETCVSDIVKHDVITVHADDDQEDVAEIMSKYDLLALPVVDETGKLLGIVTVDDALDVLEEESAEDLALATGRRGPLRVTGLWNWVGRDGWLAVWGLVFLALAAIGRGHLDDGIAAVAMLAAVLSPVVLRIAEDVAAHVVAQVIEGGDPDERPSPLRRIATDGLSGLGLGVLVGLLVLGVMEVVLSDPGTPAEELLVTSLTLAGMFALAILLVSLAGSIVTLVLERRSDAEKPVSHLAVSIGLMTFAGATFAGLAFLAAWLVLDFFPA